jgi:hypothetical protein
VTATKTAGYVLMRARLAAEYDWLSRRLVASVFSPWKLPDRNPMPMFDLFPRLSRFKRAWDRHWSEGEQCDCGDW